jgi:hypothetical protein
MLYLLLYHCQSSGEVLRPKKEKRCTHTLHLDLPRLLPYSGYSPSLRNKRLRILLSFTHLAFAKDRIPTCDFDSLSTFPRTTAVMPSEKIHQISTLVPKCDQAPGDTTTLVPLESSKEDIWEGDGDAQSVTSSCSKSETSISTYSQESWATFKEKVIALSISLFPKVEVENGHVERMKGGSSNRIAGITVTIVKHRTSLLWQTHNALRMAFVSHSTPTETKTCHYILRIPR